VFTGADSASQRGSLQGLYALYTNEQTAWSCFTLGVDCHEYFVGGFLYRILHVRHPSYLFSLTYFTSSAHTRNLTVPPHRTLAMSQSFVVLGSRALNPLRHEVEGLCWPWGGCSVVAWLINYFTFLLGLGFWVWHIYTMGTIVVVVVVEAHALLSCGINGSGWLITRTVTWLSVWRIGIVLCEVAEDRTQNISNDMKSFFLLLNLFYTNYSLYFSEWIRSKLY
jgi:hypothetical protein